MSRASDSQNVSDEPNVSGGDPSEAGSFESKTESDPVLPLAPLRILYPSGRMEVMDESSSQATEGLVHRPGRTQYTVEETGPVERASTSGVGNPPRLIDEEEESDDESEESGDEDEDEGEGDDEGECETQEGGQEGANAEGAGPQKKMKGISPVWNNVNVTIGGDVSFTRSIITASRLEALRIK